MSYAEIDRGGEDYKICCDHPRPGDIATLPAHMSMKSTLGISFELLCQDDCCSGKHVPICWNRGSL